MKKRNLIAVMALGAMISFNACSSDDFEGNSGQKVTDEEMDAVIVTYVDRVILPTYLDMVNKVTALKTNVDKFVASGTEADLNAACESWRAAREPWELSEAFLYGPADSKGLDPNLDSWPLDKDGIDQILQSQNFDEIYTDGKDGDDLEQAQSLRGFHTIEYLLFDGGNNRTPASLDKNARTYMQIVAKLLLDDTNTLYKAWKEGLGSSDPDVPTAFANIFKNHNTDKFASAANVISTIIDDGCRNIAGEVGDQKIGDPFNKWKSGDKEGGLYAVESWYSWNSLVDYTNNIISIENSYMGGNRGNRDDATSLSALVRSVDPALDTEIQNQIKATIKAINDIPAPFRNSLDKATEINAAMDACSDLDRSLLKIKMALGID